MIVGVLRAQIAVDTSQLPSAERAVKQSTTRMGKSFDKTQNSALGLNKVVRNLGAIAAGAAFAKFTKDMVMAASDFEETAAKFGTVFRGVEGTEKMLKTLTQDFYLSQTGARKYLASIQDLLVPMGMARQEAANLSFEVVKLATDLGSFNNMTTEQVMENMASAFSKEYQAMRKYGISMTAVKVEQRALAMGLADVAGNLTDAHKAQAAFTLMLQGSGDAIGDAERTADSYANTLKRMQNRWSDLQVAIGMEFLPAAVVAVSALTDIIEAIGRSGISLGKFHGQWNREWASMTMELEKFTVTTKHLLTSTWNWMEESAKSTFDNIANGMATAISGQDFTKGEGIFDKSTESAQTLKEKLAEIDEQFKITMMGVEAQNKALIDMAEADFAKRWAPVLDRGDANEKPREEDLTATQRKSLEKFAEDKKQILEDLRDRSQELTLEEKDYKIWALNEEAKAIEEKFGHDTEVMAAWRETYQAEMAEIEKSGIWEDLADGAKDMASDIGGAFVDMAKGAEGAFDNILSSFMDMIMKMVMQKAVMAPMMAGLGGIPGLGFFAAAKGGVFSGSGINAYSNSVVTSPTIFPLAKGAGLMGEAGAEAVMPLTRTSSGDLGVKAESGFGDIDVSGGGFHQVVNIFPGEGNEARTETSEDGSELNIMIERIEGAMTGRISRGTGMGPYLDGRYARNS